MKLILIDCTPFPNEEECKHLTQNDQHRIHKVTASYLVGWWPFRRRVDVTGQLYLHYGTKAPDVKKEEPEDEKETRRKELETYLYSKDSK